jgi:hypothetical protein
LQKAPLLSVSSHKLHQNGYLARIEHSLNFHNHIGIPLDGIKTLPFHESIQIICEIITTQLLFVADNNNQWLRIPLNDIIVCNLKREWSSEAVSCRRDSLFIFILSVDIQSTTLSNVNDIVLYDCFHLQKLLRTWTSWVKCHHEKRHKNKLNQQHILLCQKLNNKEQTINRWIKNLFVDSKFTHSVFVQDVLRNMWTRV